MSRAAWVLLVTSIGVSTERAGAQAAPTPGTGRIVGTVELLTQLAPRRPRIRVYADAVAPPRSPPSQPEVLNVVVYLDSVSNPPGPASGAVSASIAQVNETFVPHVSVVQRGATVEFPNRDPIFHNVFSLSAARSFDLGRYPQGESRSVRFGQPGIVQVFCHIHSDMSAVILVLAHPWFATPDAQGRFTIEGVPPGEYRLVAWHERVRPLVQRVRVSPGGTATVDLKLPFPEPAPAR